MKTIATKLVAGMLATLVLSVSAQAASVSVFLDQTNGEPTLSDGVNYLEVVVSDGIDGAIDFTVQTLEPLSSAAGGNYGIQHFALNFGSSTATVDDLILPDGWKVSAGNEKGSGKFGFSGFDAVLYTTGKNRLDPLTFSIMADGDSVDQYASTMTRVPGLQGDMLFGAHVAGFEIGCDGDDIKQLLSGKKFCEPLSSAKFGGATVVPVPPAMALMMSGIAVLGSMVRRRVGTE